MWVKGWGGREREHPIHVGTVYNRPPGTVACPFAPPTPPPHPGLTRPPLHITSGVMLLTRFGVHADGFKPVMPGTSKVMGAGGLETVEEVRLLHPRGRSSTHAHTDTHSPTHSHAHIHAGVQVSCSTQDAHGQS